MDNQIIIVQVKQKNQRNTNCIVSFKSENAEENQIEISMDLVLKFQLKKDKIIGFSEFEQIISEQKLIDAKQIAFNFASFSPKTEKQIVQKLKVKGFENMEINYSIKFLKDFNLINDEEFSKKFINDYLLKNKSGKFKLLQLLINKGVSKEIAENAVNKYFPEEKSLDLAILAAEKKMKIIEKKQKEKQKQAIFNHLLSKGFSFADAKKVLDIISGKLM